ncbi:MAG: periplasmic nitrate reductase chaperone NapD [Candidatus Electronema aureum]|uniref:Chaperone NapD n=1 Tax=Candidatus Electronema aureum TaxID=2005002 RepID=A0A521G345_9BACT|nr:MAG: periplasmic nitrate reductase chaperone NapD [Candidatus Electronema aureum]
MNISGVVVHTLPENAAALQEQIAALAGVEVHATQDDGRMVITIEDTPEIGPAETLMQVQNLPGVLSAAMIYNYCDE